MFLMQIPLQAQISLIAIQDFEPSPATPTWNYTLSGSTTRASLTTGTGFGSSGTTTNKFIGSRALQVNNTGNTSDVTVSFESINTTALDSLVFSLRVASFSGTIGNGIDAGDFVAVQTSVDGGATWQEQMRITGGGNPNTRWDFNTTGIKSRVYSLSAASLTTVNFTGPLTGANAPSIWRLTNLPNVTDLRIRVVLRNNNNDEFLVIDDAKLEGKTIACTTPTTAASAVSASGNINGTANLNWTNGNGSGRLVVLRELASPSQGPVNGVAYTANLSFGLGSDLGSGNFVVATGSVSGPLLVDNLIAGRSYVLSIYEHNCEVPAANILYGPSSVQATFTLGLPNPTAFNFDCPGTSTNLSWTVPSLADYDGFIVFAREGVNPPTGPGVTQADVYLPEVNSDFSAAFDFGARGRVVYAGAGTTANITGLTPGQNYIFRIFTYKNTTGTIWSSGTQRAMMARPVEVSSAAAVSNNPQILQASWLNPSCFEEVLVVASTNSGISFVPSGDGSAYVPNPNYTGSGEQVVFFGNGSNFNLSGLSPGQLYYLKIFVKDKGTEWSQGVEISGATSITLFPGDLMFVGFTNAIIPSGGDDVFSVMNLVDLPVGTQFMFVNAAYELGAPANVRTDRWYGSGGASINKDVAAQLLTYTGATTLTAGSVICVRMPSTTLASEVFVNGIDRSADFRISNAGTPSVSVNISTGDPDAIFLMQGLWTEQSDHYTFDGRVLGGIHDGGTWYQFSDDLSNLTTTAQRRRSRIHPDIECYAFQARTSPGVFSAFYNGTRTGTKADLIGSILNFSSWSQANARGDYSSLSCGSNFTINPGGPTRGIWTGNENTNWFDCRNWLDFHVPEATTNVSFNANHALQTAEISAAAPFALRYGQIAQTANLDLEEESLSLAADGRLVIHGNLVIRLNGSLNHSIAGGEIALHGDWDNQRNRNAYLQGGQLRFIGDQDQIIATNDPSGVETFGQLVLDKPAGDLYNFCSDLQISQSAHFIRGIVRGSSTELFSFLPAAVATGFSDISHVSGPVYKEVDDSNPTSFIFPTGKNGRLGQIGIETQFGDLEAYVAEYFPVTSPNRAQVDACLDHVSDLEHWDLSSVLGAGLPTRVTLYWTSFSRVLDVSDLRVAHYSGAPLLWRCELDVARSGSPASGQITSDWLSSFSPFTLGSIANDLSLPLHLLSFEVEAQGNTALLRWEIAQETPGVYYVERSQNGLQFETIAEQNTLGKNLYQFLDLQPLTGRSYYRLRKLELDGSVDYSPIRSLLRRDLASTSGLEFFPNPSQGQLQLRWANALPQQQNLHVYNSLGQIMGQWVLEANLQDFQLDLSHLPAGTYWIQLGKETAQTWIKR